MVNLDGLLMSGSQLCVKGLLIVFVLFVEYLMVSWCWVLLLLEEYQKVWLLWNYSDNICWEYQEMIIWWVWE